MSDNDMADKFTGCLLGGAVGDALGWPVEFLSMAEIRRKFGPEGIQDFVDTSGGVGEHTHLVPNFLVSLPCSSRMAAEAISASWSSGTQYR